MNLFRHFARVPSPSSNFARKETGMCQRFLRGDCPFSALRCPYSHNKDQAPLCLRWKAGECTGAMGNKCVYRHYYLERDARPAVTQRLALAEMEPANFSSPYQVKICKEKLVHRREEVDIETGRRRSWVEEEEREVYDLTGDTPVKPLPLPKRKVQESQSVQRSKFVGGSPPPVLSPSPMRPSSRLSSDPTSECPHHASTPASAPLSTSRRGRRVNATLPSRNSPPTQATPPASLVPVATETPIATGQCPVCLRTGFAGEKGVKSHRSHKNSKCKYQEEPPAAVPAEDQSVIEIMDTPDQAAAHRPSRRTRRSLTMR